MENITPITRCRFHWISPAVRYDVHAMYSLTKKAETIENNVRVLNCQPLFRDSLELSLLTFFLNLRHPK